jgi:tRNA 5-methylaminomethyl-2-thiouridine biosynthesis bifunctional protein
MVTRPSVAVIGAGLAGAACARALSLQGVGVAVFEQENAPALGASGNPIGILHPLVSADHNLASQWVEAGVATTLRWLRELQEWTAHGQNVIARPQSGRGNLRSETIGEQCPVLQMNADCSELVLWTAQGAWIRPAKFAEACLAQAVAQGAQLFFGYEATAIEEHAGSAKAVVQFATGQRHEFDAVIVANGVGALNLLAAQELRLNAIRGTVSSYPVSQKESLPCIVCASGYATPVIDGEMVVGASYERMDLFGAITADPVSNLERLETISPTLAQHCAQISPRNRTSVRIATHDRMPHVGRVLNTRVPLLASMSQLQHMPRSETVWALCGLGSRGLSFAPLGAEVIAAQVLEREPPIRPRLLEAADPVRFALRQHQRRAVLPRSC